jgi:DNA replication protein DnaC
MAEHARHERTEKGRASLAELLQTIPERHKDDDFEHLQRDSWSGDNIDAALSYVNSPETIRRGASVAIHGATTGVGKTTLAVCMLKEFARKGYSCRFSTLSGLLKDIKKTYAKEVRQTEEEAMRPYVKARVLCIDDMDETIMTDYARSLLFQLIETRYNNNLITIATTNLLPNQLSALIQPSRYDRLSIGGIWVMEGPSRR